MNKLIENRMHHVKACPKDLEKKKEDGEGERQEDEGGGVMDGNLYSLYGLLCLLNFLLGT